MISTGAVTIKGYRRPKKVHSKNQGQRFICLGCSNFLNLRQPVHKIRLYLFPSVFIMYIPNQARVL